MKHRNLPTTELTPHPILGRMPRVNREAPAYRALLTMVAEHGIAAAGRCVIVNDYRVVDHADVWEVAKQLGIQSIPVLDIGRDEIEATIVTGLTGRQQYTKGQIAYLAAPLAEPILKAARARRSSNLKVGNAPGQKGQIPDSALMHFRTAETAEQVAECLGISRRLFFFAIAIHKEFAADPTLRERFEPSILDQDEDGACVGLGAVVAGIAGHKATKGQTPVTPPELQLWSDRVAKTFSPAKWNGWDRVSPEVRTAIAERAAKELFATCPEEVAAAVELAAAQRLGVKPRIAA